MRALIIDDDPDFLKLLDHILSKVGYSTTAVMDTRSILSAIVDGVYDLVLVDWMMPHVDGITLIRAIRARDLRCNHNTKIIMVTSIQNTLAKNYAKRSGANAYVEKAHSPEGFRQNLMESITSVMGKTAVTS